VDSNPSHTVGRITVPLPGSGTDGTSTKALLTLRGQLLPASIGRLPGASYGVTGQTAGSYDWNQMMKSKLPLVFAFVLTFGFLLLLASFRSLVIAAKAVVLNLLSVAAAYGVVVAVFQFGWGKNLLNFTGNGSVAPWLPLFMFVILFGLSMDYHVFILSRIREAHDRGMSTQDAIAHGIKTTAGTVTSAALVMVGGNRTGDRRADRRDDRPRRPAPREHEAARRLELVPAPLAALAPKDRTPLASDSRAGCGQGLGSTRHPRIETGPLSAARSFALGWRLSGLRPARHTV